MAPSAIDPVSQGPGQADTYPAPHLYSIKEAHFESFVEHQPDGYEKAIGRGSSNAAIVIDNGMPNVLGLSYIPKCMSSVLKSRQQVPPALGRDGPLRLPPDSSYLLSWQGIGTERLGGHTHLRVLTSTPILRLGDICGMPLRQAAV